MCSGRSSIVDGLKINNNSISHDNKKIIKATLFNNKQHQ